MIRYSYIIPVAVMLLPCFAGASPTPSRSSQTTSGVTDESCSIMIQVSTTPSTYRCPRDKVEVRHLFVVGHLQKCPTVKLAKDELKVLIKLSQGKGETEEESELVNNLLDRCKAHIETKK